jgi:hypothetical protein
LQQAGEVFYLPAGWAHLTFNRGTAVGIGAQAGWGADALKILRPGAEAGDPEAQAMYGLFLQQLHGDEEGTMENALELLSRASNSHKHAIRQHFQLLEALRTWIDSLKGAATKQMIQEHTKGIARTVENKLVALEEVLLAQNKTLEKDGASKRRRTSSMLLVVGSWYALSRHHTQTGNEKSADEARDRGQAILDSYYPPDTTAKSKTADKRDTLPAGEDPGPDAAPASSSGQVDGKTNSGATIVPCGGNFTLHCDTHSTICAEFTIKECEEGHDCVTEKEGVCECLEGYFSNPDDQLSCLSNSK